MAFDAFVPELGQVKQELSRDFGVFFKNAGNALFGKVVKGTVGTGIGAVALTGVIFSGIAAIIVVLPLTLVGAFVLGISAGDTALDAAAQLENFKKSCPELASLNTLSAEIEIARQKFFETPQCVNALATSAKFPDLFTRARNDEKKILTLAFKSAAEVRKDPAPFTLTKPHWDL